MTCSNGETIVYTGSGAGGWGGVEEPEEILLFLMRFEAKLSHDGGREMLGVR